MTTKYLTINDIGKATITATAVGPDGLTISEVETVNSINTIGAKLKREMIENVEVAFTQPSVSTNPPVNNETRFTKAQLKTIAMMRQLIKLRRVKFKSGDVRAFAKIKNPLWREALILEGKIKRPAVSTQSQEVVVQATPEITEQQILSGQTGDPEIQTI